LPYSAHPQSFLDSCSNELLGRFAVDMTMKAFQMEE